MNCVPAKKGLATHVEWSRVSPPSTCDATSGAPRPAICTPAERSAQSTSALPSSLPPLTPVTLLKRPEQEQEIKQQRSVQTASSLPTLYRQ
jgi:hypothetical protein